MNSDDKLDRIEQTLRRAHQGIAAPDPGPLFTSAVMARITSQQDTEGTGRGAAVLCDRILLPFACSCAGFALVLAVMGYSAYQGLVMDMLNAAYLDSTTVLGVLGANF